jgi:hypothetical protein
MLSHKLASASAAALVTLAALTGCASSDQPASQPVETTVPTPETETTPEATTAPAVEPAAEPAAPAPAATRPVTADEVVAAFTAAGLPVTEPRDNTDKGWCAVDMYDCVEYFTTEVAAIVTFESTEKASQVKAMLESKSLGATWMFSSGPAALYFNGRDTTPEDQMLYSTELEKLVVSK